jgi:hypothetical protein
VSLAHIIYPPPTKGGFQEWILQHYAHHQAIVWGVKQKFNITLPIRMIYPFKDPTDQAQLDIFLEEHQSMHSDMNGPLNIAGNDLSDVDFKNKKQLDSFFELNYFEHLAAGSNLGLPI